LKFNNIINCLENAMQKEIILNSRINFFHGQPPVENQTNQTSNWYYPKIHKAETVEHYRNLVINRAIETVENGFVPCPVKYKI
jgi:hypothetical protein